MVRVLYYCWIYQEMLLATMHVCNAELSVCTHAMLGVPGSQPYNNAMVTGVP